MSGDRGWNLVYDDGAGAAPDTVPAGPAPRTGPAEAGSRARRVLAVADEWFPARGGLSSFNRYLCNALAAAGAAVSCLVPAASEEERRDAARTGVRLAIARRQAGTSDLQALMRKPSLPGDARPDMVIGHGRVTGPIAKALVEDHYPDAARLHFVHMAPDDIEWHKLDKEDDAGLLANERSRLELDLAQDAAAVVPVGPRLHAWLERDLLEDADGRRPRLVRLDPGFDITGRPERTPPAGRPLIMIMGRMEEVRLKGVDIAARAIGHAHTLSPDAAEWELLVRGAPARGEHGMRERLLGLIGHRSANVTVRAYAAETSVVEEDLRRASLLLMPSRVEGYGLVGHEAITAGTPALISERSGLGRLLGEVLPREQAQRIVVPVRDEEADVALWGHRIAAVMAERRGAFERAAEARSALAGLRTWAAAAEQLLDLPRG